MAGFLPQSIRNWLIGLASGRLAPALVYGRNNVNARPSEARRNKAFEFAFADYDVVAHLTRARIAATIGLPVAALESSQILNYQVGESFAPHHDFLDPADPARAAEIAARGQRIVTFLIYLSDDFEGGETAFPRLGLRHRGAAGDALYFGNLDSAGMVDRRTLHCGLAPTRGEKWVFSQWIRNLARV
jgi:predicted 2-oxoglutarate/Fe(II)-dependent dioxygenase YbiX